MKAMRLILFSVMSIALVSCLDGEDPNKQLNNEIAQIDQYLQSLGVASQVLYDQNYGFRFLIGQYGTYPPPRTGQTVTLQYIGRLFPSETLFDSGTKVGKLEEITPFVLGYSASVLMVDSQVRVYVPSKYGYGEQGSETLGVPANSILIYDIHVEKVEHTALELARFEADSTSIANYLETNQLSATYHGSGIWYSIEEQGAGIAPTVYKAVTCQYELSLLSNPGSIVDSGTLQQVNIFDGLIDGFKVALPFFKEGTKATIYVPSSLGYGTSGQGTIPGNANLIFKIDLTKVH